MAAPEQSFDKTVLGNALAWFQTDFQDKVLGPLESQFPGYLLPDDITEVRRITEAILADLKNWPLHAMSPAAVGDLLRNDPARLPLLKQIVFRYRRFRAADTESKTEKTFHLELTETLRQEVKALDALVGAEWFVRIGPQQLPRLQDFLLVQMVEAEAAHEVLLLPRQYDQKFPILQAPGLFLPDLAYFRAKCEDRASPLAVAFLDIDRFKEFNTRYTEPKVDRNVLPRFLQAVEAHVYQHGFAYHEGGDEILIIVPSFSRELSIAFLDELRRKLAALDYQDIEGKTTVSVGLCIVEADCPLTDHEVRERASRAKKFAKENGRNCIATYARSRLLEEELEIAKPPGP